MIESLLPLRISIKFYFFYIMVDSHIQAQMMLYSYILSSTTNCNRSRSDFITVVLESETILMIIFRMLCWEYKLCLVKCMFGLGCVGLCSNFEIAL